MQELYVRETERRETEVKRERDEKRSAEKEYQNKLDELHLKIERCLKEKEKELKEENDLKVNEL